MQEKTMKCVMIIEDNLTIGVTANIAGIMGMSLGKFEPEIVGVNAMDGDGLIHKGLIQFPVPILKGSRENLKEIRQKIWEQDFTDLEVIDFSNIAQECMTYNDYIEKLSKTGEKDLSYIGLAICGNKKKVNKLTGNLPLLK
ncbi:MAG: DUF2000 domain-containing protein [Lachnospiraceae bacterium]|nr:DUF2000 domain-containing protein [Lachnospiraceae bacterium]